MPWFKVDDGFHSHPKVMAAGNAAVGLFVRCGSYVAQHLTDGFVPRQVALQYGTAAMVKRLVSTGLFLPVEGGWMIHDYLTYNPTREKVTADRDAAQQRMEKRRFARSSAEQAANFARSSPVGSPTPTRPDPSQPFGSYVGTPPPETLHGDLEGEGSKPFLGCADCQGGLVETAAGFVRCVACEPYLRLVVGE